MKPNRLRCFFVLGSVLAFCLVACRDELDGFESDDAFKNEARAYFEANAGALRPVDFNRAVNDSTLSAARGISGEEVLVPHWDLGKDYLHNGIKTLEVPIDREVKNDVVWHSREKGKKSRSSRTSSRRTLVIQHHEESGVYRYFVVTKICSPEHVLQKGFNPESCTFMSREPFFGFEVFSDVTGKFLGAYQYTREEGREAVHMGTKASVGVTDTTEYTCFSFRIPESLLRSRTVEGGYVPGGDVDVTYCRTCNREVSHCVCCNICDDNPCSCYTPPVFRCPHCGSSYCNGFCRCPKCGRVGCKGSCETVPTCLCQLCPDCQGYYIGDGSTTNTCKIHTPACSCPHCPTCKKTKCTEAHREACGNGGTRVKQIYNYYFSAKDFLYTSSSLQRHYPSFASYLDTIAKHPNNEHSTSVKWYNGDIYLLDSIRTGTSSSVIIRGGSSDYISSIHSHSSNNPSRPSARDMITTGECAGSNSKFDCLFTYVVGDYYALYVEDRAKAISFANNYKNDVRAATGEFFKGDKWEAHKEANEWCRRLSGIEKECCILAHILKDSGIRVLKKTGNSFTIYDTKKQSNGYIIPIKY